MRVVDRGAWGEDGVALTIVLVVSLLGAALALAMFEVARIDIASAAAHRDGFESLHAAEGALEVVIDELASVGSWSTVLSGATASRYADTSTSPATLLAGTIDFVSATSAVQAASDARLAWGLNNPRWRLFASGPIETLSGAVGLQGPYVMVWVADDEGETDGDATADANGVLRLRAEARGRRGSRRVIEAVIARGGTSGFAQLVSWREIT